MRRLSISVFLLVLLVLGAVGVASADSSASITFETGYSNGSPNGQNGWSKSGPYDVNVVDVTSYPAASGYGFGTKALQASNAVVSGSFGDQTFTPALSTPASETGPTHFGASFDIGTTSASEQPGLYTSISPDDGNGGRMSYLRFEDMPDGVHVFFGDTTWDGSSTDFSDSDIATLTRGAKHTIRFSMDFVAGPTNDVVKIYIDGVLKDTGTSWEDYYRFDPEQAGNSNLVPSTSRLEIREGGDTNTPTVAGQGFLLDNFNYSDFSSGSLCTTTCYVDAATGSDTNGGTSTSDAFKTIGAATDAISTGGTIHVAAGTYHEDVQASKANVSFLGAGIDTSTISGAIGGDTSTFHVLASGIVVDGFTITRDGNNTTDWNNPNLNSAGVAVQGQGQTVELRNSKLTGNRTGIDINNSNANSVHNNVITDNRTGMIMRNQTDNLTVTQNFITNNWTDGVLFLDGSGGTNSPPQQALNAHFNNNSISGNWYGQVVDRQTGGSLPAPGTNLKDFSANWLGSTTPVYTTSDSTEPGYAGQIPVEFGGTATAPGGQPDVAGPASANIDFSPILDSGSDTNVDTGNGTIGFQGSYNVLDVPTKGGQTGSVGRIEEAANLVSGTVVKVLAGTLNESDSINHTIDLRGAQYAVAVGGRTLADASESTLNGQLTLNAASIKVDGFSIQNHVAIDSTALGVVVKSTGGGAAITNNLLGNILADFHGSQSHGLAIYLENGPDNVTITDNAINGVHGWVSSQAILVGDSAAPNASTGVDIENNSIKNVTSDTKGAYGIQTNNATGAGLTIKNNTLDTLTGGWVHAIAFEGPTTVADVEHNTITNLVSGGTDRIAVFFESDGPFVSAQVTDNSLAVGNDRYGVVNATSSGTLDATCNWWGDAAGPNSTSGSDTAGPITVAPWRTTNDLNTDCTVGSVALGSAAADTSGNEGSTLSTSGSFSGSVASITADNTFGDFVDNGDGTWSWSYVTNDNFATATITVTAHGTNGSTATDAFDASATNVAPTAIGLSAPSSAPAGHSFNISLTSPTDVSSVDAGSLHYAFDCGTGYGTAIDYATSSVTNSASCSSNTPGPLTVKGKVFDKDGGSNEYTASVTINALCTTDCYVDATTGDDSNGGASTSDAFQTIQAGVDAVSANGTVHVAAGTYTENVSVAKTIDLRGAQYAVAVGGRTLADASESTLNGQLTLNAASIKVDGFSIQNHVAIDSTALGIVVKSTGGGAAITNNLLGNILADFHGSQSHGLAIYLENGPDNVTITDNAINGVHGWVSSQAILVGDSSATDASTGVDIENNSIKNVTSDTKGAYGIQTNNATGAGLTIKNNTLDTLTGGWVHAIAFEGPTTVADVEHNTITNLVSGGTDRIAVFFESDGPFVSAQVTDNSLAVGNDRYGVVNATSSGTLDATCNWWGDAAGPNSTSGSDTAGPITVAPWRITSSLSGTCTTDSVAVNTAAADATGNEGSTLSTSGSFSGSVASITADNANGTFTDNHDGTWSWSYLTNDNYSATITVTAHGTNGSTATDVFNATATNVAPTATFNAPSSQAANTSFNISLTSPVDPSTVDASSLHYAFDCGSGGGYGAATDYAHASTTNSATCTAVPQAHAGDPQTVHGKIFDKDGGSTEYTAPIAINQPEIQLTPASFDFGIVDTGTDSTSAMFTVKNIGTAPLTLTSESIHGVNPSNFAIDTDNCDSVTLAPDATCTIFLVFHPTTTGLRTARLDVTSNDPNVPTASATLQGTGATAASPDAALTPGSHDFGQVKIGQASAPFSFTLSNNGTGTLNITDISLGGASPAWFTLGTTTCGSTLAATSSCTIDVSFSPIGSGTKSATLKVVSNDPDSPVVSAGLTGTSECTNSCYVDAVSGSDTNGGTSTTDAFKTIQMGVTAVDNGGIVRVAAGTYNENVLISKTVDLRGAQYGVAFGGRTLAGAGESTLNGQLGLQAANIKVDGFSIQNHVAIDSTALGIYIKTAGSGASVTNNMLGNILADFHGSQSHGLAIYLENGPDNVTIKNNSIDGVHGWVSSQGILVGDSSATDASTGVDIENNTIKNITADTKLAYGIQTNNHVGAGLTIKSNTIDTLTASWVNSPASFAGVHAIAFEGPTTVADVEHNTITNLISPSTDRIAVFFESDGPFVSAQVNRNSLAVGNDRYGVVNATSSGTLDATCNWWGDAAGPNSTSGSDTSGSVNYVPYLSTSNLDQACAITSVAVNTAAADATGNEGSTLSTSGSFSGSVASITADNANGTFTDNHDGTWSWSYLTNDNYSATITVTAHGTNGSTATDVFNATATNVAPTATFNAPPSATTGASFNISLTSPVDPSTVDASSLHYAFDCGSGYGTAISYATSSATNNTSCTAPGTTGSVTVKGKIFDKDGGSTEYTASVTITAAAAPHLSLTPVSNNFGSINTGSQSSAVAFTVKNDGTATMNLTSETLTGTDAGQFSISANTCGSTLGINATCTVSAKFAPTTGGAKSANLHVVTSNAGNADATLSGTGTTAATGGKITIVLDTTPDGGSFDFQSALLPSPNYTLTDDGSNNSIEFEDLASMTYKTQILPKSGWTLNSIACDSGSWSSSVPNKKVTINLVDGDDITCTFSESQPVADPGKPDVMIGTSSSGPFSGNDIYSTTVLASQTVNQSIAKNATKSFWVQVQNDSANNDQFQLNATKTGGPHFTVKVFVDGIDVTSQVNAGTYKLTLAGGASKLVEIRIKATSSVPATGKVDYDLAAISVISGPQDIVRAHATRS